MKISYNWLKQYLDFDLSAEQTADKLTLLGLEVEELENTGMNFEKFVVGEVLDVKDHPNADRLKLCKVNQGDKEVQIVCGADNVAGGQKVPVATVGATLPAPLPDGSSLTIKKMKLRGEVSEGMICAEDELGLGDDHSGIMVLDESLEPGTPLENVLGTEKDTLFEIGLTPNRPDAACHIGVARDLSAVVKNELHTPYKDLEEPVKALDDKISITIEDADKCHRYTAMMVDNIKIADSPSWLQNRLRSIGLRPINNVVDVTNFVMHEIGQPLHAFDYHKIAGKKIIVKSFEKNQNFTTLDGIKREVPKDSLFICDGSGSVAIAGVMGGENSEVSDDTKTVLIESAWFDPSSIRKTSKALALQTDSSYRFEREIDPNMQRKAAERAAELIADLGEGTVIEGCTDIHPVKTEAPEVVLRTSRVNHLLGTELSQPEISEILGRLEIVTEKQDEDKLIATIPTFRPDIKREVDLIEEVGRIIDYNSVPVPDKVSFASPEPLSDWELFNKKLSTIARNLSFKEITTNSLLSSQEATLFSGEKEQVKTLNPVSQESTTLRTTLLPGFLKSVQFNLNRNVSSLRFFEIGHTYKYDKEGTWIRGIKEHSHILMGICGFKTHENWKNDADLFDVFDLKSDLNAFFSELEISKRVEEKSPDNYTLRYYLDNLFIAELKKIPDDILNKFDIELPVFTVEADITQLFNSGVSRTADHYVPVSKYPPFEFDAAFIIDQNIRAGDVTKKIIETAGEQLKNTEVFDVYEGENLGKNKKSIAFRLTFLDRNKTLNIKDVEPVVQKIVQALKNEFGAKLRS